MMTIIRKSKELSAILVVSFIFSVLIFFVDESKYSFDFFDKPAELRTLMFFTVAFSFLPLVIYGFVSDKDFDGSFKWALVGFFPPLMLLCWILLHQLV